MACTSPSLFHALYMIRLHVSSHTYTSGQCRCPHSEYTSMQPVHIIMNAHAECTCMHACIPGVAQGESSLLIIESREQHVVHEDDGTLSTLPREEDGDMPLRDDVDVRGHRALGAFRELGGAIRQSGAVAPVSVNPKKGAAPKQFGRRSTYSTVHRCSSVVA
jgi:hypothetical protein